MELLQENNLFNTKSNIIIKCIEILNKFNKI